VPQSAFAYNITLTQPSSNIPEGILITFTGTIKEPCDDCLSPELVPAHAVTVHIMDHVTGLELTSDVSDVHGTFSAQWTAQYRPDDYLIYAVAYWEDVEPYTSAQYPISVYQQSVENNVQLILKPPSSNQIQVGAPVTFYGYLEAPDKFDKRIQLKIDENVIAVQRTDQNGQFSFNWKPESNYVGTHQVHVSSVEYEVDSEYYNINVIMPTTFTVSIIADPINDIVPFWVYFDVDVSGGTPPYTFLWNIAGETITQQSFDKLFEYADTYPVTLSVTDSASQTKTDQIKIFAEKPPAPPLNPQIIMNQNKIQEGDEVSFYADVLDENRVKSYEWIVDGNTISASKDMFFVFEDDGSYTVSLNVVDIDGEPHHATKPVSVLNVPPKITTSTQNYKIDSGKQLSFDVLFTDPGVYDEFTIEFFIDNQRIDTISKSSPELTTLFFGYPTPGVYNAKVVVTDNDGDKDERNFLIEVIEPEFPIGIVIAIIGAAGGGGYGIKKYLDSRNDLQVKDLRIEIRIVRSGIER